MKQYELMRTDQVLDQLDEIITYIAKTLMAPEAAGRLLDTLELSISSLGTMPKRYQLVTEEPWHSEGIRRCIVAGYMVYYWIKESADEVWIIAVVSQLRNQLDVLKSFSIVDEDVVYGESCVAEP